MKVCPKCEIPKPLDDFNWRSRAKGTKQSICKECQRQINTEHYKNNSADYKRRSQEYRVRLKEKFAEWLSDKKCIDCGETDPVVLDCDHVSGEKKYGIAEMLNDARPWDVILEELAKCEIRCANCHRRRTAKQFNWRVRKSQA